MSFPALHGDAVSWTASQELYTPRVNATLAASGGRMVTTTAEMDPDRNVFVSRVTPSLHTPLIIRLSTQLPSACSAGKSCMADLPMTFAAASIASDDDATASTETSRSRGGGTVLTMARAANHMVNNEATLVECDPALIPTMGYREFSVAINGSVTIASTDATTTTITSSAAADEQPLCLALLPREDGHAVGRGEHVVVSQAPCSRGDPKTEWVLHEGKVKNAHSNLCLAYAATNNTLPVSPCGCDGAAATAAGLAVTWSTDSSGCSTRLSASAWIGVDAVDGVPTKGVP